VALPKKNRLTSKKDIDHVFKKGRTVKGNFLFIKRLDNQRGYSRFAFIIPSKHVPLAADRNKIRRIFSEEITKTFLLGPDQDTIVVICKTIERRRFKELAEEIKKLLNVIR